MTTVLYPVSVVATLLGIVLLFLGLLQEIGVVHLFDDSPLLVGAGVTVAAGFAASSMHNEKTESGRAESGDG
jgi:hypothetical protein